MKKLIKKLLGIDNLLYLDKRQITNIIYFHELLNLVKDVRGNVVECGIGKGRTFLELCALTERDVWGFDSFQGFPEPSIEDKSPRNPKKGELNFITPDDLRSILRKAGVYKSVNIVKGFFEDSLDSYDQTPIALLHIDVDLYDSYKIVLEKLYPFVSPNGIIAFDEYGDKKWLGATLAIDQFLKKEDKMLLKKYGKHYIIK